METDEKGVRAVTYVRKNVRVVSTAFPSKDLNHFIGVATDCLGAFTEEEEEEEEELGS